MRISLLSIGAIASILSINSVFATTSTVTSKDYVDAADALKQNKIPATGTNASTPGTTVVTYTGTAGTIGERGICNDPTDNCNQADIATFGLVGNAVEYIQNNMPAGATCYEWSGNDCILVNMPTQLAASGESCTGNGDCDSGRCCNNSGGFNKGTCIEIDESCSR